MLFFQTFYSSKHMILWRQWVELASPVWIWGSALADGSSCLWGRRPTTICTAALVRKLFWVQDDLQNLQKHTHTHLLPEADFPGDVCVGVMLLCAAPLQLCLDALRFHWKISGHWCVRVCVRDGEIEMVEEDIR